MPGLFSLERVTGIEPVSSAWKAEVLAVELHPRRQKDYLHEPSEPHHWCSAAVLRVRDFAHGTICCCTWSVVRWLGLEKDASAHGSGGT